MSTLSTIKTIIHNEYKVLPATILIGQTLGYLGGHIVTLLDAFESRLGFPITPSALAPATVVALLAYNISVQIMFKPDVPSDKQSLWAKIVTTVTPSLTLIFTLYAISEVPTSCLALINVSMLTTSIALIIFRMNSSAPDPAEVLV